MAPQRLLIRADANVEMGIGHVMRCLALAESWREAGGHVTFRTACSIPEVLKRIAVAGADVVAVAEEVGSEYDAKVTGTTATELKADWVFIDGYHLDNTFQRQVQNSGTRLAVVDDFGDTSSCGDIVINYNAVADILMCGNGQRDTRYLIGPQFVLMRQEFRKMHAGFCRKTPNVVGRLLISLGGTDPDNVTARVISALDTLHLNAWEAKIVLGAGNPHYKQIQDALSSRGGRITLLHNVSNMPDLIKWAELAIGAGGVTSWERVFFQLPTCAIVLADNQRKLTEYLHREQLAVNLGSHHSLTGERITQHIDQLARDFEFRSRIAHNCGVMVDGDGADRIVMHMQGEPLRLRNARLADCEMLWKWANDALVRRASFRSEFILWEDHVDWFGRKLTDPTTHIFVAIDVNEEAVGQIRFEEFAPHHAVIDVSIAPQHRSKGYATHVIRTGAERLFRTSEYKLVSACIKVDNEPSLRAFVRAGFSDSGQAPIEWSNQPARHFTLHRQS